MVDRIFIRIAVAIAACLAFSAFAQEFPTRGIRVVMPVAPGNASDILGRIYADELTKLVKQTVVVDNRPGAGGDIAAAEVAHASPDGYTLLFGTTSVFAGNRWLFPRTTFDQDRDLFPISLFAQTPLLLLRGPNLAGKSLQDVIAMAKASAKPFAIGSSATVYSVLFGLFREASGAPFLLVPYKASAQSLIDLHKNDIQLMIEAANTGAPLLGSDSRLGALAVTSAQRLEVLPNVPTLKESGIDVVFGGWNLIAGPRGMPAQVIQTLNQATNAITRNPDVRKRMASLSTEMLGGTPEDAARRVQADGRRFGDMITRFNLK